MVKENQMARIRIHFDLMTQSLGELVIQGIRLAAANSTTAESGIPYK